MKVSDLLSELEKGDRTKEHLTKKPPENISVTGTNVAFTNYLRAQQNGRGSDYDYQKLAFTLVENYPEVPPAHVLDKMEEAVRRECFDIFEVAHIVDVKDPILFGRVKGCPDLFFIDQWDEDVKIEDILEPHEG